MKKLLLIALVAGGFAFATAPSSNAGVAIGIGVGYPGYGYPYYGCGYPYPYYGYGYYRPYYYGGPSFYWYRGHRVYYSRHHPLRVSPDRGILFPVRATLCAVPAPFASSARHSFETFVDLPEASRSIDHADCSDSERAVAEASCDHADLGLPAAAPLPIRSQ